MKVGTLRFVVVAVIAALVVLGGSTTAWGEAASCPTSPNYATDFSSNSGCVAVNQNAVVGTGLQLTANSGNQYGSGWYTVPQVVQNGFTTTFQFQFTATSTPADGIAFVIQNAGTTAIGSQPSGGAIAYGDHDGNLDPSQGEGIPNSLAIEFDTYQNGWDPAADPLTGNVSHVAVQSCGTGPNTSHHNQVCSLVANAPNSTLGTGAVLVPALASTGIPVGTHTVVITYNPATTSTAANLHVMLDGQDLYPSGVPADLNSIGLGAGGTAFVGFTGATGGSSESQVIQNWTFTPQTQVVTTQAPAVFNSQGGFDNNPDGGFDYNAQLNAGTPVAVQVKQILMDQAACTAIVQRTPNFHGAQCFAYRKADGTNPKAVMFEITCPLSPGGTCGTNTNQNFNALLGTDFHFDEADNAGFHNPLDPPNNPAAPFPGWLKGDSGVAGQPCFTTPTSGQLFTSNQVNFFQVLPGDPPAKTKGGSGGTGSCWVATYNQPDEALPGIQINVPADGSFVAQGSSVAANFGCSDPTTSQVATNPTGPYLTSVPGACVGTVANGSNIDTATADTSPNTHSFTVKAVDTGSNPNSKTVHYTVVAATDLAILNVGSLKVTNGGKVTYGIGVGDLGSVNAVNVTINDTLPATLSGVKASGQTISCAVVNKKLVCTTTPATCTVAGNSVSCSVGPLAPLSWSSLNGATIQITATATAPVGTVIKNTATVIGTNVDPKLGNNSSTASTSVTAH
jgi:uncharacterized repeat protein (TIGR01451 family)